MRRRGRFGLDLRRFRWHRSARRDGTCYVVDVWETRVVAQGLRQRSAQRLCMLLGQRFGGVDPIDEPLLAELVALVRAEEEG